MFNGQEKKYAESKIDPEQRRASMEAAKMKQYGRAGQAVHIKCQAEYPKKIEIGEIIEVFKETNEITVRVTNGERTGETIEKISIAEWEPLETVG